MEAKINKPAVIAWCLYDWACSSFSSIVTTFIFATYFTTQIAENSILGTYQWASATSIAGVIIALCSPIFGSIADYGGQHKLWLFTFTYTSVIFCALLWFAYPQPSWAMYTLIVMVIATVTYEIAQVFYNAFLLELVPRKFIGRVSGWGWGLGYFGGIVALALALFIYMNPNVHLLDTENAGQIRICGPFVAIWYGLFALPIFFFMPALDVEKKPLSEAVTKGIRKLFETIHKLFSEKNILIYLSARMFYIDGLNTLFAFGGIYAAGTFGLSFQEVMIFGISMNVTAGLGAIALSWVDDWIGPKKTIFLSLVSLISLGFILVLIKQKAIFWGIALLLCSFVGPVQSASRSMMTRLITTKEMAAEMFGLYALSGKITAFMGPWVLGMMTYWFASQRMGMASILIFFIIGGVVLYFVQVPGSINLAQLDNGNRE